MLLKYPLLQTTLINLSIPITLVMMAVTAINYWHLVSILESQPQTLLENCIVVQEPQERSLFQLPEDNHAVLKQELWRQLEPLGTSNSQEIFKTARFILLSGVISLLLVIIILFLVLRKQVAVPLKEFMEVTDQITAGNFKVHFRTAMMRPDELGRVAQCFNLMAMKLDNYRTQLEQLLEERTAAPQVTHEQLQRERPERTLAENKLKKERDFISGVLESIGSLVIVLNPQGHIVRVNRACEQVTGYSADDMTGKYVWDFLITPAQIEGVKQVFNQLTVDQIPNYYENHWLTKDGRCRLLAFANTILLNEEDKLEYIISTTIDITEHRRAEIELQQAKAAAEMANQSKSTFLANMSHELRTPLNSILGYTQLLGLDRTLTDKQREDINIIQRSGDYLLTLINDVLDLSKIEAGKIELYATDFHFGSFLQSLSDLFQLRAKQKKIAFLYQPLSHLPQGIHADEKRLRQILINLLGNAIKFTETGRVTFKVGLDYGKIRFQIEDTGVGIATTDLEKIFLPFQQVGHGKYYADGTGLGLSITKKLVEMMGGELRVESIFGQGSTFWFVLELPEVAIMPASAADDPIIIGCQGALRKILLIDNTADNRSVLVNLLTPLGFGIIEASNGQEGIDKARQWQPDLILTELVMPGMDGLTVIRTLRQLPQFQEMPIIAVSASVFEIHQQQSLAAGCNDFIAKPVRVQVLLEKLRIHLKLTWRYESDTSAAADNTMAIDTASGTTSLIGPSPKQAAVLFDLAMNGDISGILVQIKKLEQSDKQLVPFVNQVRQLAKNFDEEQICNLVERYL